MTSSKFSITSFVISILFLIFAIMVSVSTLVSDSTQFAQVSFGVLVIFSLLDFPPFGFASQIIGVPVLFPLLSIIFACVGLRKKESKSYLATSSLVITAVGIVVFLVQRYV